MYVFRRYAGKALRGRCCGRSRMPPGLWVIASCGWTPATPTSRTRAVRVRGICGRSQTSTAIRWPRSSARSVCWLVCRRVHRNRRRTGRSRRQGRPRRLGPVGHPRPRRHRRRRTRRLDRGERGLPDRGRGPARRGVQRRRDGRNAQPVEPARVGVGSQVNLERAAAVNSRLGGHIVQGHVDGTGHVIARTPSEHWEVIRIALPTALSRYVVEKGSITVDGVSLTVSGLGHDWFEVSLIPTTLDLTTLGKAEVGTRVNLEVDIIAKYVERLMSRETPST